MLSLPAPPLGYTGRMSEEPAANRIQYSLKSLFWFTAKVSVVLAIVVGGSRWIVGRVRESERQWRMDYLLDSNNDRGMAIEISQGWLDEKEIQALLKERGNPPGPHLSTSPKKTP